ncbi:DUF1450 domain-containing protein [Hathewaya histolytica]|uniref:Uncharacterized protein conserved in bacteria n=2 Tax=Hathewaya histolytica TaxID=1498 RepID=A0A4U9R6V6_HATHI|nr:DUF1450 domain-containing protein [Hathewaya histolytica]VTQ86361.1 Uncharacterized protein conserved in bacteria [Hathewaya histolytica]
MQVSFCKENTQIKEVYEKIYSSHPEYRITWNKCIGECSKCSYKYIARVEGKFIEGDTAEELYEKIINFSK